MSTKKDYYDILGLPKGAGVDEIKKAYRQLVMKYHPDRVEPAKKKGAEERFKEISEAYAVLSDPQKKQLYDQYGPAIPLKISFAVQIFQASLVVPEGLAISLSSSLAVLGLIFLEDAVLPGAEEEPERTCSFR